MTPPSTTTRRRLLNPLRVSDLDVGDAVLAAIGVGVIAGWCGVLVAAALGWEISPEETDFFGWMAYGGWRSATARTAGFVGFGIAAVLAVAGGERLQGGLRRVPMAVGSVLLIALGVTITYYASDTFGVEPPMWSQAAKASAIMAAGLIPFAPVALGRARRIPTVLAVVSLSLSLLTFAALGDLAHPWAANVDWRNDGIAGAVEGLRGLLVIYLLWGLFEWAGLLADWSTALGRRWGRHRGALATATGLKVAWLLTGLAGVLPAWAGGRAEVWTAMRADWPAGWVTALAVAAILLAMLAVAGRTEPDQRPLARTDDVEVLDGYAVGLCVVLALPPVAGGAIALWSNGITLNAVFPAFAVTATATAFVTGWSTSESRRWLRGLGAAAVAIAVLTAVRRLEAVSTFTAPTWFAGHYFLAPALAVVVLTGVGLWVVWRRDGGPRLPQLVLLIGFMPLLTPLAVLHVAPRVAQTPLTFNPDVIGATGDVFRSLGGGEQLYVDTPATWERWWVHAAGTFDPATFDGVVTVAVAALLLVGRRRPPVIRRSDLLVVLIASTVLAHSATLAPIGWLSGSWFFVALIFPVLVELVYDARDLNVGGPSRGGRVLLSLASILVLTTIVGWLFLVALLDPQTGLEEQVFSYSRGISLRFYLIGLVACAVGIRLLSAHHRTPDDQAVRDDERAVAELDVAGTAPPGRHGRRGMRVRLTVVAVTFYAAIACIGLIGVWRFQDI